MSPQLKDIYVTEYLNNRTGACGPLGKTVAALEGWMHRRIEGHSTFPALEIGSGTLNHLKYVDTPGPYDIVEPFKELYADRHDELAKVRSVYTRLADVPPDNRYSRIFSIAVFEHMVELPEEIERTTRLLAEGGLLQVGIPCEGGLLWGLSWRLTTGMMFRLRTGLDYAELMRHEHVNRADEIILLLRHWYREVTVRYFPLPLKNLSVYAYIEARDPRRK